MRPNPKRDRGTGWCFLIIGGLVLGLGLLQLTSSNTADAAAVTLVCGAVMVVSSLFLFQRARRDERIAQLENESEALRKENEALRGGKGGQGSSGSGG